MSNVTNAKAFSAWCDLCAEQDWGEFTQALHMEAFLINKGLMPEFLEYAKECADEENGDG